MIHDFILNAVDDMDLQSGLVQIGRLVETCPSIKLVGLGGTDSLSSMRSSFHYPGIDDLIDQLETYAFQQRNGARANAKQVAVLFLDEDEHDIMSVVRRIQNLRNINVLTIILGDEEKYMIPNTDDKQYVTLPDYNDLSDYTHNIQSDACFCGKQK